MTTLPQNNNLAYLGVRATLPANVTQATRAPTANDVQNQQIGDLWIDTAADAVYGLADITAGAAVWAILGGAAGAVATLTGDAGGAIAPAAGNITLAGGTGIATAGAGSTITFNVVGGGFKTVAVAGAAQALAANVGYIAQNAGLTTFTLPAAAALGDSFLITGTGAGGWTIAQNAGQSISMNATTSTVGVGGSVASTSQFQSILIRCIVANTGFAVVYTTDVVTIV